MLLLITDTSGKRGFVGIVRATEALPAGVEVADEVPLAGGTFSAELVPQIAALLEKHGLRKADIEAFVVVSGPGSFTGLRVGLSAIKALAEILRKPIVPVSLLEAIALASGSQGRVSALLDAGRGDAYVGEYEVSGEQSRLIREELLPQEEFFSNAASKVATPDESLAAKADDKKSAVVRVVPPGAEAIARLGWRKLQAGETVTPEQLDANYIRRSVAEIFSKPTP